jgi:K+-transporting ATPase ATPase C chain
MSKDLIRGSLVVVVFTVLLGLVYPLVMTGIAQVAFPGKADGSLVRTNGKVTGSTLLARDVKGNPIRGPRPPATAPRSPTSATTAPTSARRWTSRGSTSGRTSPSNSPMTRA